MQQNDDTNADILYLIKAVMRMVDCTKNKLTTAH